MSHFDESFDPLKNIKFKESTLPRGVSPLNFRVLSPYERALMVSDGTVTNFIEAYTLDPLEIVSLKQEHYKLEEPNLQLQVEKGVEIVHREVLIRGRFSDKFYVYAVSYYVPERLPSDLRSKLEKKKEGIGRIIRENHLETRREVLWFGKERLKNLPLEVSSVSNGYFMTRAYRIMFKNKPLILLFERFPVLDDQLPKHH